MATRPCAFAFRLTAVAMLETSEEFKKRVGTVGFIRLLRRGQLPHERFLNKLED